MFVRDRRRHRTVKADLLQVGRSQSPLFLREQWERLRERGIEWKRGGRWRWMLLIKMSRQWRQCRITQTLIRVFVRGHKMRAAHPSSPLSSLFPPSFQPFSPLSFPLLILFNFFFSFLSYWCPFLTYLSHTGLFPIIILILTSPLSDPSLSLYYRHEIQRQHNFYCFTRSL